MTTRTDYHADTGREFLARARAYLDEGDLLQASEKGWGAAAQLVKAAAEARGRPHRTHRDLYAVVRRLAAETGDRDIQTAFAVAGALHQNFCEGWLGPEDAEAYLDQVSALVGGSTRSRRSTTRGRGQRGPSRPGTARP